MELDVRGAVEAAMSEAQASYQDSGVRRPRPPRTGQWSESALRVLNERYLIKRDGQVVETPDEMCWRVACAIAGAERRWGSEETVRTFEEQFYDILVEHKFMPNSPTLMNAGTGNGLQYSACYVLPVGDSIPDIFDTLKNAAIIHQSGGGTGFAFSRIRRKDSLVSRSGGRASGPVSFLRVYNAATEAVKQGGTRRGANMGILRVDHPDVLEFIDCKNDGGITNFNISVAVTDAFMDALRRDDFYDLVDPHSLEVTNRLRAREVWTKIIDSAWRTGDPGLVFIDRINNSPANPTPEVGMIEATNPCGEQPLLPNEACNLGSLNLAKFVVESDGKKDIDWAELERVTKLCVRFLDDVIEVNPYPLPEIDAMVKANRRIGLGIMGWADLLFVLGIPYDSDESIQLADRIWSFVERAGHQQSQELAAVRGPFANWDRSIYRDGPPLRNSTVTTIAPTGTISIIADASSGIEPIFALAFQHKVDDRKLTFVNPIFVEEAERRGVHSESLMERISAHGSVHGVEGVPDDMQRVFVTAHEIEPEWHVRTQAAFQRHTDNGVSKCIAAGTLIPTSRGLIPIEDFADTEDEDTFTTLDYDIEVDGHKVLSHYRAGVKPATKITLDNGASLTAATDSHRVMTVNGWKRMAEVRPGDMVMGRYLESHGPGGAVLPPAGRFRTNANSVSIPTRMTPALATLLGMVIADGHTIESTGQVGLTHKDETVESEFVGLVQQVFGESPKVVEDRRNGVRVVYVTSRNLARFIEKLIGKGAYHKVVPAAILQGSAEEKLAFLRGISLDGYNTGRGLCIYGGMSEECAYHVAEICRSFGLPKVWQGVKRVPDRGVYHYVVISGELQALVRCIEEHKNVEPSAVAHKVLVGAGVARETYVPIHHTAYSAVRAIRQEGRAYCMSSTATALGWSTDKPVHRVVKVEDAGLVDMYDIEVDESHAYVVNGMVSHNTINLPNEATREDVEEAYNLAWNLGCLGITVFRDGCKGVQVLNVGVDEKKEAPVEERPTQAPLPGLPAIKPRPRKVSGETHRIQTPIGTAYVTVNMDDGGEPLETFVHVGSSGSDVMAVAEALGRLISLVLRTPSPLTQREKIGEVVDQLSGIGGSRSLGFGAQRVLSLPDALAQVLDEYTEKVQEHIQRTGSLPDLSVKGDICPSCGWAAFVHEEGCKKCHFCGHSEC